MSLIVLNTLSKDQLKKVRIDQIDLSGRLKRILIDGYKAHYNSGEYDLPPIKNLGQLLEVANKTNDIVFLRIPDFGRKSLKELHLLLNHCFPDDFIGIGNSRRHTAIYTFKE